jgi:hypothetical protein
MQPVEQRLTNLKRFIADTVPNAPMLQLFMAAPTNVFLQAVAARVAKGQTVAQIADEVMEFARVKRSDFSAEQIEKFELYCEYFMNVVRDLKLV